MPAFFREMKAGIAVSVRVTPRASKDAIEGIEESADGRSYLKVRLRAVPERGKANAALERLLANALGVSVRQVQVTGGAVSRLKTVTIEGDAPALAEALLRLAAQSG